jgi:hypothetical protein
MKRLVQQLRRKYFVKPSESTRTKRHEDLKKETSFGYIYARKDYRMRETQSSSHVVMDLSRVSSTSTTTHTSLTSFFKKEAKPQPLHRLMHTALLLFYSTKV